MNQFDGNVGGTVTLAAGAGLSCPLSPPTPAELSVVFSRTVAGFQYK